MDDALSTRALMERVNALERQLQQADDIRQIERLKYLYCMYNDGGWKGYGPTHSGRYEDIFAEDIVWDGRPNFPIVSGREDVLKYFRDCQTVPFAYHGAMNPMLTINGNVAEGHWHLFAYATMPDGNSRWVLANHIDKYVRTSDGWRYKEIRADVARTWIDEAGGKGSESERLL